MSEIEVPLEKIQEDISHAVERAAHSSMMNTAALSSALLAVAAAVCALFAGHFANDAMVEQIQSSDHWSHYQAKSIKMAIADLRNLQENAAETEQKIATYKQEQNEIRTEAEKLEVESRGHLKRHEQLAASVTFFQVAIALTAIAVLTRKRRFLLVAMGLGFVGLGWTVFAMF